MKETFREYLRLIRFVKPYIGTLIISSVYMVLSTLFGGVSLTMLIPFCDRVLTNKKIIVPFNLPPFAKSFVELLNTTDPVLILRWMSLGVIILFLIKGIILFLQSYLMNMVGQNVVRDVKNQVYEKLQTLSMDYFAKKRTGELISRITNDVTYLSHAISYGLTDLVYQTMQIVFFAIITVTIGIHISWKLMIVAFVIFPTIMIPVSKIAKRVKRLTSDAQKGMADLSSLLTETLQGIAVTKIFCRQDYEIKRFKAINHLYNKNMLKTLKRTNILSPLTEFIGALGSVIILLAAGEAVINGKVSFGVFGLFIASLMSMLRPVKRLSNVYTINQQSLAASKRIYEVLDEEPSIKEIAQAALLQKFNKEVCFKDVWFSYRNNNEYALEEITLTIKKNEVIAFVGHSGAGKTSLVSLLPRLYDPSQGVILIDGKDLRQLNLNSLRAKISVVSQDIVLFNTSIRDNIAYGKKEALEEEIYQAAEKAYALKFIDDLVNKFDTVIGDRGVRLSGGEKQRIILARAILKDAPILILDEATSQLDSESEQLIQKAFEELMKTKTVLVIAHRLSTVQKADRIVVLDKGRIVEQGTHAELIEKASMYRKLHDLQFNV